MYRYMGFLLWLSACGSDQIDDSSLSFSLLDPDCEWTQHSGGSEHLGLSCAEASGMTPVASVAVNPFFSRETSFLQFHHFATPLARGSRIWTYKKGGNFDIEQQTRTVVAFDTDGNQLTEKWKYTTDWRAVSSRLTVGHEQLFAPVLAGTSIYVPGAKGAVFRLSAETGEELARIQPFQQEDANLRITGGLSADSDGNVYYTAAAWDGTNALSGPLRGSWLVRIGADDSVRIYDWVSEIAIGMPKATDLCERPSGSPLPCGPARPDVSRAPAISADGSEIVVTTHSHFNPGFAAVVKIAINGTGDISHRWTKSLRDLVPHPVGRQLGTDDLFVSQTVFLPDGGILFGAFSDLFNGSLGFTLVFNGQSGELQATFPYGLDETPSVYEHDGTYSIVIEQNNASFSRASVTQLSPKLNVEWKFSYTGTSVGVSSTPIVDPAGNVYSLAAVSSGGQSYTGVHKIAQGGILTDIAKLGPFQDQLSQAIMISPTGKLFAPLRGDLWMISGN